MMSKFHRMSVVLLAVLTAYTLHDVSAAPAPPITTSMDLPWYFRGTLTVTPYGTNGKTYAWATTDLGPPNSSVTALLDLSSAGLYITYAGESHDESCAYTSHGHWMWCTAYNPGSTTTGSYGEGRLATYASVVIANTTVYPKASPSVLPAGEGTNAAPGVTVLSAAVATSTMGSAAPPRSTPTVARVTPSSTFAYAQATPLAAA